MLVTYKGASTALHLEVGGKAFRLAPSQPVEVNKEQVKNLQERPFIKLLMEADKIEFSESEAAVNTEKVKTISKMTVADLEEYIIENGGEFAESDNKPDLLEIALEIEADKDSE